MSTIATPPNAGAELHVGRYVITFSPHHIAEVGPLVFVSVDDVHAFKKISMTLNMSSDDARRLADRLKIAACEAESKTRRAARLLAAATSTQHKDAAHE